jgi:hypothetical protein
MIRFVFEIDSLALLAALAVAASGFVIVAARAFDELKEEQS